MKEVSYICDKCGERFSLTDRVKGRSIFIKKINMGENIDLCDKHYYWLLAWLEKKENKTK